MSARTSGTRRARREGRAQRREARRQGKRRRNRLTVVTLALVAVLAVGGLIYAGVSGRRQSASFAVDVGDRAPDFSLRDANSGREISLQQLIQPNRTLLFFFEGIMCQPCWDQLRDFERVYEEFRKLGIEVVGVPVDPLPALSRKGQLEGIGLPVLADERARVSRMYDTLAFGSMHPGQRPGHTFILVDRDGIVRWRRDFREMYVPVQAVLTGLRSVNQLP